MRRDVGVFLQSAFFMGVFLRYQMAFFRCQCFYALQSQPAQAGSPSTSISDTDSMYVHTDPFIHSSVFATESQGYELQSSRLCFLRFIIAFSRSFSLHVAIVFSFSLCKCSLCVCVSCATICIFSNVLLSVETVKNTFSGCLVFFPLCL